MSTDARRNDGSRYVSALAIVLLAIVPAAIAEERKPTRAEQLRANRPDPRCAAEGEGFVYEPSTGSCIRVGGSVIVQGGRGDTSNLLGR